MFESESPCELDAFGVVGADQGCHAIAGAAPEHIPENLPHQLSRSLPFFHCHGNVNIMARILRKSYRCNHHTACDSPYKHRIRRQGGVQFPLQPWAKTVVEQDHRIGTTVLPSAPP